jgi:hypothetical protein
VIAALTPFSVGAALALVLGYLARVIGFDRDRSFYPTVLIVIAAYYILFAAVGGSGTTMAVEMGTFLIFSAVAVLAFRTNIWIAAAGLSAHGVFDGLHGALFTNPGAPEWWPMFCLGFDVAIAAWLCWNLRLARWPSSQDRAQQPGTAAWRAFH